ncbi:hypothetical protein GOPIP_085_00200 [Gordonia polyisoprenivorans NBRC 16320 = JCM 10675]|uniref:DUF4245 domain-containing protein n=1 Tax=Gordonia polyisoprenivorans TaxID=84595 RepID=A0A846WJF4_9ACTN|nr:DUF4245 domain-containing protein [Gordonia polyisoprenivorans]NKY01289.1 DUF4245 domain-containing protein [Gordonia polyisoprenivorans]OZC29739.1 DUF4245 domain-containing protein [Gordonia polyisoprenivorans]QUD81308.1 DUF4245 domain-containing protein [Gordonia polyisoprenivorans]UZF58057.1 DUF4245 domain-containing protein [Gordonia polyisoprenivorans]WCB39097.1 DUF4245 domain-containing protein [Gordonia polyisoprenivorans]
MAQKPRYLVSGKDMIWSIIPLLAICALVAIASGNCSVGLTGSASDDRRSPFDVQGALLSDSQTLPFPIRKPPDPAGWKPSSGSRENVAGHVVSNVGWITNSGSYVQLTQTDASEDELVDHLADGSTVASGTGTREIGGQRWVTYSTHDGNKFWITDLGSVRIAVMSTGSDSGMATMAESVIEQQPLPGRG